MENLLASLDGECVARHLKELNVCLGPEALLDPELLPLRWPRAERMRYAWTEYYRTAAPFWELYGASLALGLVPHARAEPPRRAPAASDARPSAPPPVDWFADKIAATATACARSTIRSSGTRRRRGSCARRRTRTTAR